MQGVLSDVFSLQQLSRDSACNAFMLYLLLRSLEIVASSAAHETWLLHVVDCCQAGTAIPRLAQQPHCFDVRRNGLDEGRKDGGVALGGSSSGERVKAVRNGGQAQLAQWRHTVLVRRQQQPECRKGISVWMLYSVTELVIRHDFRAGPSRCADSPSAAAGGLAGSCCIDNNASTKCFDVLKPRSADMLCRFAASSSLFPDERSLSVPSARQKRHVGSYSDSRHRTQQLSVHCAFRLGRS